MTLNIKKIEDIEKIIKNPSQIKSVNVDVDERNKEKIVGDYLFRCLKHHSFEVSGIDLEKINEKREKYKEKVLGELDNFYQSLEFKEDIISFLVKGSFSHKENFQRNWSDADLVFYVEDDVRLKDIFSANNFNPDFSESKSRINSINFLTKKQMENGRKFGFNCRNEYDIMQIKKYGRVLVGENPFSRINVSLPNFISQYKGGLGRLQTIRKEYQRILKEEDIEKIVAKIWKNTMILTKSFTRMKSPGAVMSYYKDVLEYYSENFEEPSSKRLSNLLYKKNIWPVVKNIEENLRKTADECLNFSNDLHKNIVMNFQNLKKSYKSASKFEYNN